MNCHLSALAAVLAVAPSAFAQSSSLYVSPVTVEPEPLPAYGPPPPPSSLAPALRETSFTTVRAAEPRMFQVHDLVQIIVRENSEAESSSSLETEKEAEWDGELDAFPRLALSDLIDFKLRPGEFDPVELRAQYNQEFQGEGEYERKDSVSDRITARVIDVKPNGLLVLEARKEVVNDQEELTLSLTGTCRAEDVSIDNTVLSTQLYDLRLDKQHKGELRKTAKKGILTKVLEGLFNF